MATRRGGRRSAVPVTEREYNALREIDRQFGTLDHTMNWGLDYDVARGQAGAAEDATGVPYSVFVYAGQYGVSPTKWLTKSWFRKVNPGASGKAPKRPASGKRPKGLRIPNPACGGSMPVNLITDRAKRYRANHPACVPPGPKVCAYCKSKRNVEVHHKDGNEANGRPSNLAYACRSCNTRIGFEHRRKGKGKRTRQFNPAAVPSKAQYLRALSVICRNRDAKKGYCSRSSDPEVLGAVEVIRATPLSVRREYSKPGNSGKKRVPF